ncbi:hypothetical protein GCM10009304_39290 [Pseudomonas matsuisoli]|uniref:Uncharacterized protein n=1 Tax=Pseudomonas matsuisoli TaxID=1515666 RepID=A0A917Q2S3_9PSED|nr:hypothetical protein GCM10009304_39290 [Pseudomonas matsuisoli]
MGDPGLHNDTCVDEHDAIASKLTPTAFDVGRVEPAFFSAPRGCCPAYETADHTCR